MLKTIRITFYIALFLFLLDLFDFFQTKIGFLKSLIYYVVLIFPLPLLILEFIASKNLREPILRKGIPILVMIGLIYLNPLKMKLHTRTWKTQTITLINENMTNHKVEFQMKDLGDLGFAKRTAEVVYFTKYFYFVWVEDYDDRNFLGHKWKQVDQNINEIGLNKEESN